jgi:putative addiction module CopG family antidote
MTVSIPSDLVPFVDELVAKGGYSTADAVIGAALAQMRDRRSKFDELKASLDDAVAELDRGEGKPLDFAEIKRKGRLLHSQRHST